MEDRKFISGHMTMADGSRVPMTEEDATAIWASVEAATAKRAEAMPIAKDALSLMIDAKSRMNELGWWLGGSLRVKKGDDCAVAETGSTGMWKGRIDAEGEYVHYGDCVSKPQKVWLKPLSELTDDERAWVARCDNEASEAYRAMIGRWGQ